MNWKAFSIVVINAAFILLPNIRVGSCPETPDPEDAFTSFFRKDLSADTSFKPFYYIEDHWWHVSLNAKDPIDARCADWVRHYHHAFSVANAHQLICKADVADLESLYTSMKKGTRTTMPPGLRHNPMAHLLRHQHDTAALRYIIFARNATIGSTEWEFPAKDLTGDSMNLDRALAKALTGYQSAQTPFLKMRYGYQCVKLAFYNGQERACEQYATTLMNDKNAAGSLYAQTLSYKAGVHLRQGKDDLAAYEFSRAFQLSDLKLKQYTSLLECINTRDDKQVNACLSLCHNNGERANFIGLCALGSAHPELPTLRRMAALEVNSPLLEVLTLHEVNKIEEKFFSPRLHRQEGGLLLYTCDNEYKDSTKLNARWKNQANALAAWADQLAHHPAVRHQGLYETVAAYCNYMLDRNVRADSLLDRAAILPASAKLRAQQVLTRLLVRLNQLDELDETAEWQLLPTIQWLEQKAIAEKRPPSDDWQDQYRLTPWRKFYRNLMAEVLAKIYHDQNDSIKELLCIGAGEQMTWLSYGKEYRPTFTKERLEAKYSADQLDKLWKILYPETERHSSWLAFLAKRFPVKKSELVLARAMAYTREHRWDEALVWLARVHNKDTLKLHRDPFVQSLLDQQVVALAGDDGKFDCIGFVRKMRALTLKERAGTATAQDLYLLATGYYNMTYYGRAWETVRTERSGGYWETLPRGETAFEKDYYNAYTAEKYYKKAFVATKDKNQQARCLFMMAKCAQKQMRENFFVEARHNKYFPVLVRDYKGTQFYQQAFNTCSYLRDFVPQSLRKAK